MKKKKILTALVFLIMIGICGGYLGWKHINVQGVSENFDIGNTAKVTKGDIATELKATGTLEAKNTYKITSMVEGEILKADFKEGDQVEKGQILYEIDKSSMDSELSGAKKSYTRFQNALTQAKKQYNRSSQKFSGNTYKAKSSGYIKELYIKAGSKVGSGTKIANLYSDRVMKLKIPFLSVDSSSISAGMTVVLTLSDTGEQVQGTVESVASQVIVLSGGRLVQYVTISVQNPGGLTTSTKASATIGSFTGVEDGTFEPDISDDIEADLAVSVEVASMLVKEGDYVKVGTPLFRVTQASAEELKSNMTDSLNQAEENAESAKNKLDTTTKTYENYTIEAPISGQVVAKKYKAGDVIGKNANSDTTLAVIYDLSKLTFKMPIDELDIYKVKVGQKVTVTADVFPGKTFTGTVTNVSLESTVSDGVSTYPVIVTLDDKGELIPGINVVGKIMAGQSKNTLLIPAASLIRGNQVYIKDDSVKESQQGVPAGFRSVTVETGLISADYVEITSGLSEGDEVYIDTTKAESSSNDSMYDMGGDAQYESYME